MYFSIRGRPGFVILYSGEALFVRFFSGSHEYKGLGRSHRFKENDHLASQVFWVNLLKLGASAV